jgi:shikimate dehydrogenase
MKTAIANRFAVIGHPVDQSLSPFIHHYFAQETDRVIVYEKIDVKKAILFEDTVGSFFVKGGKGLNVTLPFKQKAWTLAENKTSRCLKARAANTLWMQDGNLWADNTDGVGFLKDVSRHINLKGKRVLLLGAGGAARGLLEPLLKSHLAVLTIANRSLARAESLQNDFKGIRVCALIDCAGDYDLIINATSASVKEEDLDLPVTIFRSRPLCYDLAYRSTVPTTFVRFANEQGCQAIDGLGMLVEQAAESFFIWNGVRPGTNRLLSELRKNG